MKALVTLLVTPAWMMCGNPLSMRLQNRYRVRFPSESLKKSGSPGFFCVRKSKNILNICLGVVATKSHETTYTLDDAMDILLTKLDDAINDIETGRVQTLEEAWKEIDEIQSPDYRNWQRCRKKANPKKAEKLMQKTV